MDVRAKEFKIVMLFCYFGEFPWYFDYFCKSCSYNPSIDFIIFTDNRNDLNLPPNMRLVHLSLGDIRKLADEKLGFQTALNDPYKLCDFKPVYGLLFSDLITGYDFWGHGDIDVIYGNIRAVITDEILEGYDVISGRPEYVTGFFALFRNNEKITQLFRESEDYKKVFQDPENYCFDECNWNFSQLWKGKSIFDLESEIESMTHVVKKLALRAEIKAYFEMVVIEGLAKKVQWNKGALLTSGGEQRLLYHFIEFKGLPLTFIPKWNDSREAFFIHSFYISQLDPGSVQGVLKEIFLRCAVFFHRQYQTTIQFVKWLIKYWSASRKVNSLNGLQVEDILGPYKREDLVIDISMRNGRIFAEWKGVSPLLLLHKSGNKFMAAKFNVKKNMNIDAEFRYDRKRSKYVLHIIPFRSAKSILLYAVNNNR